MDADGFMDINLRSILIRSNRLMNSPRNFKNLQQFITYRQRYKLITILNMIINKKVPFNVYVHGRRIYYFIV